MTRNMVYSLSLACKDSVRRFVSMASKQLMAISYTVTPVLMLK